MQWKMAREMVQEYKHILISCCQNGQENEGSTQKLQEVELKSFYIPSKAETQSQGIWSCDS
jgi:hypothetical protein